MTEIRLRERGLLPFVSNSCLEKVGVENKPEVREVQYPANSSPSTPINFPLPSL